MEEFQSSRRQTSLVSSPETESSSIGEPFGELFARVGRMDEAISFAVDSCRGGGSSSSSVKGDG